MITASTTMIQVCGFDGLYFTLVVSLSNYRMQGKGCVRGNHTYRDFTIIHKSFVYAPIRGTIIEVKTTHQLQLHLVCRWKKP